MVSLIWKISSAYCNYWNMMLYFALKVPAWSCLGDLYDNALCVAVEPASWPAHYRWAVCAFIARPGAEWTHADGLGTPGTMTRTSQVFMNGGMCLALVDPENRNLVKLEGSLGGGVCPEVSPCSFIPTNQAFAWKLPQKFRCSLTFSNHRRVL